MKVGMRTAIFWTRLGKRSCGEEQPLLKTIEGYVDNGRKKKGRPKINTNIQNVWEVVLTVFTCG